MFVIESLTDDGLNEVIRIVDVIAGNPKLSTLFQFEPYFQQEPPETSPQTPPTPQGDTEDTTPPPAPPEGPPEGE